MTEYFNVRFRQLVSFGCVCLCLASWLSSSFAADDSLTITVQTGRVRQTYEGLGCGVIFYEGHITSLAARQKEELQQKLYDDMFKDVPTDFLQLMIRETHEPANDNDDPYAPKFSDEKNFAYCEHTLQIAKAALARRPKMQFVATLYTPPSWMKTNNDPSGGGAAKATVKDGLELELAEYVWIFLAYMHKNGVPVQYVCICNEPDWPHEQPGYFLTPEKHAALLKAVGEYFDKMAEKYPNVPRPKFVSPNTLSAPAAKDYVPQALRVAGKYVDVIASHDYDQRGDRWGALRKLGGKRSIWLTEWCARDKDASPGMMKSALQYGSSMHDAFKGGVNVYMAYDWVYPPRDSGEAFIHVNWGNDYQLTKPYYLFRQWAEPLTPGMKVVEVTIQAPRGVDATAVKPTSFLAEDGGKVVVHVVNAQDKEASIVLKIAGKLSAVKVAQRSITSADQNAAALADLEAAAGGFSDKLPAQSMVTYGITQEK